MKAKYTISENIPPLDEYIQLRESFGWTNGSSEDTKQSLRNSLYRVCIEIEGEFVGFGRVVGDGILNFYVQDIMVKEPFKGRGFARIIMENIMRYINNHAAGGAFIGLFSAPGVEDMYKKFGFNERPSEDFGAGMFQKKL